MSVGKYSPTVNHSYAVDPHWWEKNGGGNWENGNNGNYDDDGYDEYGYDRKDRDRAGVQENDYIVGQWVGIEYVHLRYEDVYLDWCDKLCAGVKFQKTLETV